MLVNTHKQLLFLLLFIVGIPATQAGVWKLQQCIDTAILHNKTLKINRNSIAISEQRKKEAKANLLPKVTANADYKYFLELPTQLMPTNALNPKAPEGEFKDLQFGVPHNINANLQLVMQLYNPQVFGAIHNTEIAHELNQIQYQKTEEQVLYDITTLFYNAQILQHQIEFLEKNLENTNKLLNNLDLLKEQLLAKATDVSKVQLQTEQLKTQKENARNKYLQILNALKLNMGIALETQISVNSDIIFQTATNYTSITSLDIQHIQTQKKLLHSESGTLNKSRVLPSLNLIASYGTTGYGYDKSPNNFLKFYPMGFAGLQLSFPLFNGTVTLRKINQKRLEISNNELQEQLMNDKNKMETENSARQKNVAQQTVLNTEKQIALAQSIYDQTILQQKQGTATLTDVLLADNALREAQQYYISAVIDYLKADLDLKKVTGTIKQNMK